MKKSLIVSYSFSGNTKALAEVIASQIPADIRELLPRNAYAFDYNTASKEVRSEIARGFCPELLSGNEPISEYDTVLIGSPNWFKSIAPPVLSFLRSHDFSGKAVVPFCTHGGGGFGEIQQRIAQECSGSTVLPGFAAGADLSPEQVRDWLLEINLK